MQTFAIVSSIIISALGILLFALSKYRAYVFNKKSYSELVSILRRSRSAYIRLDYEQRNTRYGRLLDKSIISIEHRIKQMDNA